MVWGASRYCRHATQTGDARIGEQPSAVAIQSRAPFPLTPALSPRRGSAVRRAGKGSPSSEGSQMGVADSFFSGERVRVRGNSTFSGMDTASGGGSARRLQGSQLSSRGVAAR
jgi:hypothetical protein